jgi:uncharacterized protein
MGRDLPQILQGLLHAGAYPHSVKSINLTTTHISWVLLTGDFVYKIKRPVRYPFVDRGGPTKRDSFRGSDKWISAG